MSTATSRGSDRRAAGVVELVDTPDLGSGGFQPWGFKSLRPHHAVRGRAMRGAHT